MQQYLETKYLSLAEITDTYNAIFNVVNDKKNI